MRSSYLYDDVEILLKDITGLVEPLPANAREKMIQSGTHYCEMLPLEYTPTEQYMQAYRNALENYSAATAKAICVLSEKLFERHGNKLVVVSLARAGIPLGILIKRYINTKYNINIKHYSISIIRGRGIDRNALKYILSKHEPESVQFVDGWIGKGAILRQLSEALKDYPMLDASLAVISDPANLTKLCGTHEDILIPSSCLNATVTGLISRTFLRSDIIGPEEYHGAAYYGHLADADLSNDFLMEIEKHFSYTDVPPIQKETGAFSGMDVVEQIAQTYGVRDINFIKPGIGETTRVLLRRIPWKVIVNKKYTHSEELAHIYQLAKEKNVICEESTVPLGNYKVCGIIKDLSDI